MAWQSASCRADVVAAMAQAYGVPVDVVATAWPPPDGVESALSESVSPAAPTPGPSAQESPVAYPEPPDPGRATTLDGLVERLRLLKVWAGDPSYRTIKDRVNVAWTTAGRPAAKLAGKTTVVDCFRPGRRRLNTELVVAVVQALHPDVGYVAQWRQALRVIGGESRAASQVRVQDTLPPDPAGFTGRATELHRLRRVLDDPGRT